MSRKEHDNDLQLDGLKKRKVEELGSTGQEPVASSDTPAGQHPETAQTGKNVEMAQQREEKNFTIAPGLVRQGEVRPAETAVASPSATITTSKKGFFESAPVAVLLNHLGPFCNTSSLAKLAAASRNNCNIFGNELTERKQFLRDVAQGNLAQVKKAIEKNPHLLLAQGPAETHAKDLNNKPVVASGWALGIACGADHLAMIKLIIENLDKIDPKIKFQQYQAQFPLEEEKEEALRCTKDEAELYEMIDAIRRTNQYICRQFLVKDEKSFDTATKESAALQNAFNKFRNYLTERFTARPIAKGKHFNMQLLMLALRLFDINYTEFSGAGGQKNILYWRKVLGLLQRFVSAYYAQIFSQGVYYLVEEKEELKYSFKLRQGGDVYFPLGLNPNMELGLDCTCRNQDGTLADDFSYGTRLEEWALMSVRVVEYIQQIQQACQALEKGLRQDQSNAVRGTSHPGIRASG